MKVWAAIAYNASLCMSATMVIRRFCECCNKHPLRIRIEIVETLQTFDWNEPVLPMQPGQVERCSHDDPRDGTTTLVAGLNSKSGKVTSEFHRRSGRDSSVSCSTRSTPACRDSRTHETPAIHRWLARHSRVHLHFAPTGSSWTDLVERRFAAVTKKGVEPCHRLSSSGHTGRPEIQRGPGVCQGDSQRQCWRYVI